MGTFQPAVLPTAVWQDFSPLTELQVNPSSSLLTAATAKYPCTTDDREAISAARVHTGASIVSPTQAKNATGLHYHGSLAIVRKMKEREKETERERREGGRKGERKGGREGRRTKNIVLC